MGWFDEQIKLRIKNDNKVFSDAFSSLSDTVMNKRLYRSLSDNRAKAKNAIDEILSYYGEKPSEPDSSMENIDDRLEYIMHPLGIIRRSVKLTGEWYKEATGVFLTFRTDDGSPVSLIPRGFLGYSFLDTATGKTTKVTKKNCGLFDVDALCFYKPPPVGSLGMRDLRKYIFSCFSRGDAAAFIVSCISACAVGLAIPAINSIIYSDVIYKNSLTLLFAVFTFLISVQLSQVLIDAIRALIVSRISGKISGSVHTALMMRLLSLSPKFFKRKGAGELASAVTGTGEALEALTDAILTTVVSAFFSLLYIYQMYRYGGNLVFAGIIVVLFSVLFAIPGTVSGIQNSRIVVNEKAREEGLTYSLITGIQKIRLSGAEKRAFSKWARFFKPIMTVSNSHGLSRGFSKVASVCMPIAGNIIIYYFAVKSEVRMADFFAFYSAFGLVSGAFSELVGTFEVFSDAKPVLESAKPILEVEPEIAGRKTMVSHLMGGIEVNHLSFSYSDDSPKVLDDLSIKIRPGQYVAIVGESGCGKSTLMRLLLGFERPDRGAIYYDGKDISSLDLKSLRRNIGTVLQNERLFQGDIFSNITISSPLLTLDDAWKAAEMAGFADDIKQSPMGMHTIVSDGGGGISGGQRQRIIIARAIANKPRILMFDEATSALDNITQKIVSDSLEGLKCTRIVIAHRLSTIRNCDRILVLNKGKIVEDGDFDELISKGGIFAELMERQKIAQ